MSFEIGGPLMSSDCSNASVESVLALFKGLYDDLEKQRNFATDRPFLAHYTSVQTLEQILLNKQLWFAHPLSMNDRSEITYGLRSGMQLFVESKKIEQACKNSPRWETLRSALLHYMMHYEDKYILDTYVACFSEHDPGDTDGLLSMWRAYGANGNGAAIVFDTSKIPELDDFPIILAPVAYLEPNARNSHLKSYLSTIATVLANNNIPDNLLYIAAHAYFERLKLFSLFVKHHGFNEEREWRAVYMPDRDERGTLKKMIGYSISSRGVEPRLKLEIDALASELGQNFTLDNLISQILIGPTQASGIQRSSMRKLLLAVGSPDLVDRCVYSNIPFRG